MFYALTPKAILLFLMTIFVYYPTLLKEKFEVKGNCGMCEKRIEKAAKAVDGVSSADWDQESKMIVVTLDSIKTSVHKVQMAIADAGHDTPMHKAKDEVYNKLPGCCKYDRTDTKKEMKGHEGHMH